MFFEWNLRSINGFTGRHKMFHQFIRSFFFFDLHYWFTPESVFFTANCWRFNIHYNCVLISYRNITAIGLHFDSSKMKCFEKKLQASIKRKFFISLLQRWTFCFFLLSFLLNPTWWSPGLECQHFFYRIVSFTNLTAPRPRSRSLTSRKKGIRQRI